MISHQYAQVNASSMENYDVNRSDSYIVHLDANILYGWAMSQPLPTSNFKQLTDEEIEELDVMIIPGDSSRGCISECDLGKYYFYYLYIHVMFLSYEFQSTLMHFVIYIRSTHLNLNLSRQKKTYLATVNVTFCKMKDSANLYPSSSRIYTIKRTASSTTLI